VSSNSSIPARDLKDLVNLGYKAEETRPMDMFPHTCHVETITVSYMRVRY